MCDKFCIKNHGNIEIIIYEEDQGALKNKLANTIYPKLPQFTKQLI